MYSSVKTYVKGCNSFTDYFECVDGLKQGEGLSPVLFSLLLDLEPFLQDDPLCGLNIDEILLVIVLFADDMILFGNSPSDLRHRLDKLVIL